jgi:hypothetical protein
LKELVKHTDEAHPDYANLTKALKDLNAVAQKINERYLFGVFSEVFILS